MDNVGRLLLRLLLVPLGAVAAVTVASLVVIFSHTVELRGMALPPDPERPLLIFALVPMIAFVGSFAAAFSLAAAAIGALIAETFAIRSWLFHAANGGLAGWIGWSLTQEMRDQYGLLVGPKSMVAAGLAGGLAYWLVAGWTAGFWKPVSRNPQPQGG